ncbi:type VI secretion system contractile sheath large subunit, partial [Desulfovibrio sp. OttesenSCG-928-G11]|nr:type VI secretion system contractile sheath large subunit [Desulfovibrio sp. OttesenSCG-928-G11]
MSAVLDEILATVSGSNFSPAPVLLTQGLRALLRLAGPDAANASPALADFLIALIDEKISAQVNAILHHSDFTALESSWRGLLFLTERLDFTQNIVLEYINVSKADLLRDFQDAPEVVRSGLYRHVYTA